MTIVVVKKENKDVVDSLTSKARIFLLVDLREFFFRSSKSSRSRGDEKK